MRFLKPIHGALALALLLPVVARADAVLNECTQPALEKALAEGGRITVNCDGTLVISNTIVVSTNAYVDATGHRITITSLAGTNAVRLFTVNTTSLSLINFTLTGGRSTNGGAIYNNRGSLMLDNCVLSNHLAVGANGGNGSPGEDHSFRDGRKGRDGGAGRSAYGGAIYNLKGTTFVNRCSFFTNASIAGSGGFGGAGGDGLALGGNGGNGGNGGKAQGGAIFNAGLLVVSNSTFMRNSATAGSGGAGGTNGIGFVEGERGHGGSGGLAAGGAICTTNRGRMFVYGSTFALNGVLSGDSAHAGTEVIRARTGKQGGHSYGGAVANYGTNGFLNCTFFSNKSTAGAGGNGSTTDVSGGRGGDGGHAYGGCIYSSRFVGVTNCTFFDGGTTGGVAGQGGLAPVAGRNGNNGARRGGNISMGGGSFVLKNSLIAFAMPGTNGYGTFKDAGFNLSSDRSIKLKGPGSMTNADPVIGLLGRNGGLTETIPLFAGSPAINAGDTNFCILYDQRGVSRPYDARCDIGAYEFGLTLVAPTITSQPQSQTAQNGATVTFIVVAEGDPPLTYQWRRGNAAIPGATGPVLTLNNVQSTDVATYTVVVANNSGSTTSSGASLSIIDRVEITGQPQSSIVFPGSNHTFTVTATGAAPLFYQWYFNGALVPGAILPTFTIVNAQDSHVGSYQVLVYNSFSSATSAVAVLTVGIEPPTITADPVDEIVDAGTNATLMVEATGSQPLSFQWYFNLTNAVPGATSPTLTITNVQAVHAGSYNAIVTNALGSATSSVAMLTVTPVPPRILSQPASQTPCFNDTIVLRVVARGTEPIAYQWFLEGNPVAGATNAELTISSVQTIHAGTYTVTATNELGMVTSDPAELTVTSAPNITQQPQSALVGVGSNATFSVGFCTTPGPFRFQWYLNDEPISGATNAMLVVSANVTNTGNYVVIITNLNGEAVSDAAVLTVLVPFNSDCEGTESELVLCDITFETVEGFIYTIERKESVDPEVWIPVTSTIGDGFEFFYTDKLPGPAPEPEYRVIGSFE